MRATSLRAFDEIVDEGLLPPSRMKVYKEIGLNGPLTGHELNENLRSPDAHKRLSELARQGVIEEIGTRPCRITGREALAWAITDRLPGPLDRDLGAKPPSKTQLTNALEDIRRMQDVARAHGYRPVHGEDLRVLALWLRRKAGLP